MTELTLERIAEIRLWVENKAAGTARSAEMLGYSMEAMRESLADMQIANDLLQMMDALDAANKRIAEMEKDAKLGRAVRNMGEASLQQEPRDGAMRWICWRWDKENNRWKAGIPSEHDTPEEALGLAAKEGTA